MKDFIQFMVNKEKLSIPFWEMVLEKIKVEKDKEE